METYLATFINCINLEYAMSFLMNQTTYMNMATKMWRNNSTCHFLYMQQMIFYSVT